jgi:hypothetical protein
MKKLFYALAILIIFCGNLFSQENNYLPDSNNMFTKSLHYTFKGLQFIYSKEQGGLERLTGRPFSELGCAKSQCHITSCDVCHKSELNGKSSYSIDAAKNPKICEPCHGDMAKDNPDVHFAKNMKCTDCHTSREMHGDGIAHNTFNEPGFFDAKCSNCHASLTQSASHTVHKDKLDCLSCHMYGSTTCLNCHIDSRLKGIKGSSVQMTDMYFLVNHDGKVKLANLLSYVCQGKTMITFAPAFSHSIRKEGRKCSECHNSQIVKDIQEGKFKLASWENGALKGVKGVVPVVNVLKWNIDFLDRVDSTWILLNNPPEPIINYSGYCTPLSLEQFGKLNKTVSNK